LSYLLKYVNLNKLIFLNRNAIVSQIPNSYNYILYARSSGTYGKILNKNSSLYLTLIKLPSGAYKLFNSFLVVTLNKNSLPNIKKIFSQKAGFFSSFGKKPHVRGVARNAVDHPHGGRTKSIKCPRTP
jgi:large subunit ribosomal protein L2